MPTDRLMDAEGEMLLHEMNMPTTYRNSRKQVPARLKAGDDCTMKKERGGWVAYISRPEFQPALNKSIHGSRNSLRVRQKENPARGWWAHGG